MDGAYGLRRVTQSLATGLNAAGVARNFGGIIPTMGIDTACLAVLEPGKSLRLRTLLAVAAGAQLPLDPAPYPAVQLLPSGFPGGDSPSCLLCLPLTFERQVLGLVVFGAPLSVGSSVPILAPDQPVRWARVVHQRRWIPGVYRAGLQFLSPLEHQEEQRPDVYLAA